MNKKNEEKNEIKESDIINKNKITENHLNNLDIFIQNCLDKFKFVDPKQELYDATGKDNNEIINDFWIIDNNQYSIKYLSMPSPKSNHSMINLNDEYILILGGNDTKTYLFNIEKNEFIFFENTNNTHLNPYIILFNNYIYCFSEQSEIIIAEKKLFSLDKNLWENINLSLLDSEKDNEISFLKSKMQDLKNTLDYWKDKFEKLILFLHDKFLIFLK